MGGVRWSRPSTRSSIVRRPSSFKDSQSTRAAGGSSTSLPRGRRCAEAAHAAPSLHVIWRAAGLLRRSRGLAPSLRSRRPIGMRCPPTAPCVPPICPHHLAVKCPTAARRARSGPPSAETGRAPLWICEATRVPSPAPPRSPASPRRRRVPTCAAPTARRKSFSARRLTRRRRGPIPRSTGCSPRFTSNPQLPV